ncbi:SIMPL domain-containing protein [Halobacteriales archaeon SW_6_65_46]|nr:MAG: SIMPL domain-containing protein [Halobacteriales archaeon SW_6_65_46]
MRQQTLLTVGVAMMLLVSGVGIAAAVTMDDQPTEPTMTDEKPTPTVTVSGVGNAETAADRAVVSVTVEATADSAGEVRDRLAANASGMRDALAEAGIESDQLRTARYDISRNYERREDPDAPAYRGQHGFEILLSDTEQVGTTLDAAVEGGASYVEDIRFTLSDAAKQELRTEALTEAMATARGEAETLADSGGLELDGTAEISTTTDYRRPVALSADSAGEGAATSIDAGPVSVSVTVEVTYEAQPV